MAVEIIRTVSGYGLPLRGDNIDTDRIIPARFLKSITFDGLEAHLFEDDRLDVQGKGSAHPLSNPLYENASILIVNANFGCGSSREHAPQAIRRRGIRAVVGESFSEIFFGNSVALGMPCVTAAPSVVDALMTLVERAPSTELTIHLEPLHVTAGAEVYPLAMPDAARDAFLDGSWDATGLLLDRFEQVEAVATRLPYLQWRQQGRSV
jgi:3-isopropylmalate/(R)-2-methylmalate dehydratase small subunit